MAGTILLQRFQKMRCIFRGRRSILETSDVILRGRRSTLDVSCCVFFANRIVSAVRSGDKVQIPSHFVTCDENQRMPRTKRRFWGRFILKIRGGLTGTLDSLVFFCRRSVYGAFLSEDELHFSWQAQHFGLWTPPSSFLFASAAL